jgi:hypothetical protein
MMEGRWEVSRSFVLYDVGMARDEVQGQSITPSVKQLGRKCLRNWVRLKGRARTNKRSSSAGRWSANFARDKRSIRRVFLCHNFSDFLPTKYDAGKKSSWDMLSGGATFLARIHITCRWLDAGAHNTGCIERPGSPPSITSS